MAEMIEITDDFSLSKITGSGQCFRAREFEDGTYRFITKDHVLYIRQVEGDRYEVSCDAEEWTGVWKHFFDLERNYREIRASIPTSDTFLRQAASEGEGIRILNQDPFEMLVTSIITQRKSIPAIKASVEMLAERYGAPVETSRERLHLFPTPAELAKATEAELAACKLGYRTRYVMDAAAQVAEGKLDLEALEDACDCELMAALEGVLGVGVKVASCAALFAYGRGALAPIDTWINKIIAKEYGGVNPFGEFGGQAGILQQYMFYYALNHKERYQG